MKGDRQRPEHSYRRGKRKKKKKRRVEGEKSASQRFASDAVGEKEKKKGNLSQLAEESQTGEHGGSGSVCV